MRRLALATAALVAAVAVLAAVSLPPARLTLSAEDDGTVPGAMHVHTNRSDGRSAPEQIAEIAARAGLKFLVFTDHGDGTRRPDPPTYRSGVLCLDGVEISTTGGHYLAVDMPVAPYPLGGDPAAVVADVNRLGGFGVAAHPDSPKAELRWTGWTTPIDGLEIMNPDTSWRVHLATPGLGPKLRLAAALLAYPVRAPEAIGRLLVDSEALRTPVQDLWREREIVATAGVDAHANLELAEGEAQGSRFSLPVPAYEASFQTLTMRVAVDSGFSGDAAHDARSLVRAIRGGRLYAVVNAFAGPPSFGFSASNARGTVEQGQVLEAEGPVTLRVRSNAPADFRTTLLRNGEPLETRAGGEAFTVESGEEPAVYRVEIRAADRPGQPAWLLSNPVYVRRVSAPGSPPPAVLPAVATRRVLYDGGSEEGTWTIEAPAGSLAALDPPPATGGDLTFRYALASGPAAGQYAALVANTRGVANADRIAFSARAERPMRLSVQLRVSLAGGSDDRWQRSVYLDESWREQTVRFDEMTPVGGTGTPRPALENLHSIVFAVELTNTKPGTSGRVSIRRVVLQGPDDGAAETSRPVTSGR